MVTVSCEYSDPAGKASEDRRISGVYQAKDARWRPLRSATDRSYLDAAKRQGQRHAGFEQWLPTDPAGWPDFLFGYDAPSTSQIRSLITATIGCGGIRLPVVDGRVVQLANDP